MDHCIESPFPFDPFDEICPLPSLADLDYNCRHQEEVQDQQPPPVPCKDKDKPKAGRRKTRADHISDNVDGENVDEQKKKKIIHRDVERQRRQEMATLYASLRSQLPVEYLKGKRSISDHMNEAVKFIKHLQSRIQELSSERDKLKHNLSTNCSNAPSEALESSKLQPKGHSLVVKPNWVGVQVIVDVTSFENNFALSTLVKALMEEGLQIISCISTKMHDRLLHIIDSQVHGGRAIDFSELEQKLASLI